LRTVTMRELLDRGRQAVLSRMEGAALYRRWLLSKSEHCLTYDVPHAFGRLCDLLPTGRWQSTHANAACVPAGEIEQLLRTADRALESRFDLLGFQGLQAGTPVDWHVDPVCGRRVPLAPWKQLDSSSASIVGDRKIIWELNRHQHLLTLARAFACSSDERYASAVVTQIASWIRDNPYAMGINWSSSLELAFRSIHWLWSIALIRGSRLWPTLPSGDFARALYHHGRHIETYLSTYSSPNTHLTGEALGLYYLGTCLPSLDRASQWRELGRSILLDQLDAHVLPDGVYFEQSTWYQRYTADFYTHFVLLATRAGDELPSRVRERLAALLEHLMWITRPDGTSPFIGDDDGGKLVKLDSRPPDDWRAALSNGAVLYQRGDFKHVADEFAEESCWLGGADARDTFLRLPATSPSTKSRAFRDGGIYVMRSGWAPDSNYLAVDCGPHGKMNCGHSHADALSIELAALGSSILVDPGTHTYTGSAELRDLFRSTRAHNCLTIDGLSSSVPGAPFKWKHVANCVVRCWHDHPAFTYFEGDQDGYTRLRDAPLHSRSLLFANREYWIILDNVVAGHEHEHEYDVHFQLASSVIASLHPEAHRLQASMASTVLDIVYPDRQGSWTLSAGQVSPCYGTKLNAPHAQYSLRATGRVQLLCALLPRRTDQPSPDIRKVGQGPASGFSVTTPFSHDVLLRSPVETSGTSSQGGDFRWAWIRSSVDTGILQRAILLHGSSISRDDFALTMGAPVGFAVLSVEDDSLSVDMSPPCGFSLRPPSHVATVIVNGQRRIACSGRPLVVFDKDVPPLGAQRDPTEHCSHVRH